MTIIKDPDNYKFSRFEVSKVKNKKYDAILINKLTGKEKRVSFGDKRYEQYKDSTGLGEYTNNNHLNKDRRRRYRERHEGEEKNKFSSGWFSWFYLW